MAAYHINQRARIVGRSDIVPLVRGKEVTIRALPGANPRYPDAYGFQIDGMPANATSTLGLWWGWEEDLRPLTDPDSSWASQAVRDLLRKVKEPLEGETVMGEK